MISQCRPLLGIAWVVYGCFRLASALCLVAFTNTATVMFGQLLARVPDPFSMMNYFHAIYFLAVILAVLSGLFGLVTGWALFTGQRSGRTIALVASVLALSDIPLGTTIGIYTMIVVLPTSRNPSFAATS